MKKALIVAYNDLNNSGVPNVIYQTVRALHCEYIFDILVFGDDEYYYQKLRNEGIAVNLIKYNDQRPKTKLFRLFWWFYKRPHNFYCFAKKIIKENHYSVVHSFKEYDSWPFLKAAKKARISKRIFHCNVNLIIDKRTKEKFLKLRNKKLSLRYANTFVGVSELSCKNAFRNKKYTVLYNSYDEYKYNMNVRNILSDEELVITQVASYSENKNQIFSLQVLKELKKLHKNAKLNLVGSVKDETYYHEIEKYVKDNNLENNISYVNQSVDVEKIYEKTTFVIIPSFKEGFSLVAIEGQACGLNVFASDTVPREVNCGGVLFLSLDNGSTQWAHEIYNSFIKQGNKRLFYNLDKFSSINFKNEIFNIYQKND